MSFDPKKYPADWKEISQRVKEAAGWRCQRCHAPHGETVTRIPGGFWSVEPAFDTADETWTTKDGLVVSPEVLEGAFGIDFQLGPEGQLLPCCRVWNSKVILTAAHLGENRHDKMDCSHLQALCQSCHLSEDHADHIAHARQTRLSRRAAGSLFGDTLSNGPSA